MKSPRRRSASSLTAIAALILTLLITVSFAGCEMASLIPVLKDPGSAGDPVQTPPETTPPSTEPEDTTPTVRYFNPLTGLETTQALSVSRPVAFCLGNTAYSLPQFGVGSSDVLLEFPIENGGTRLVMLTTDYATIDKIGPIRSTRDYIADIAGAFDAIQLYAGTSDQNASVLFPEYDTLDYLTQNLQSLCYLDTSRVMPHNLMTTGALTSSEIASLGYRTEIAEALSLPFRFAPYGELVAAGDRSCTQLMLTYSASHNARFVYDASTREYTRYQLGEAHIDGNDGTTLSFKNLLILFSDSATYETVNGSSFSLLLGSGSGKYVTDGTVREITWTYTDGSLAFFDAEGNPLTVNRGSSYIGFMKVTDRNNAEILK